VTGLPRRLVGVRDFVRSTIGERWQAAVVTAAGSTVLDYAALLCALRAVGAEPRPSLVLLAYTAAQLFALIPLTPGGLGFVEAGLVGALALAGVSSGDAVGATLLYRIVSYWLPILAGAVAYVLFRRRYEGLRPFRKPSAASPIPSGAPSGDGTGVKSEPGGSQWSQRSTG